MKRIIAPVVAIAMGLSIGNAFELNTTTADDFLKKREKTEVPMPIAAEIAKTPQEFAYADTVAEKLRKDLKSWDIQAKVTVAKPSGKKPYLVVTFTSREEYEQIEDTFYQDPGPYPGYMGVGVSIRVPKKIDEHSRRQIISCETPATSVYTKLSGVIENRQAQLKITGDLVDGETVNIIFSRKLRVHEENHTRAKYASDDNIFAILAPKYILDKNVEESFNAYILYSSDGVEAPEVYELCCTSRPK